MLKMNSNKENNKNIISDETVNNSTINSEVAPFDQAKEFFVSMPNKLNVLKTRLSSNRGYVLIVLVLYVWVAGVILTSDIILNNTRQLKITRVEQAKSHADHIGIATGSPIKKQITDEVHLRVQEQLKRHLQLNKSDADTYLCQGIVTPTEKNGGTLTTQFGLCEPSKILADLVGKKNQSIDFISGIYPEARSQKFDDPILEQARQSIIEQHENSYSYNLHATYVGQQEFPEGRKNLNLTGFRRNQYRWNVRAEVETKTFVGIINQLVFNFSVSLEEKYVPVPFAGADDNCNMNNPPELPPLQQTYGDETGNLLVCTDGDCIPIMVCDSTGCYNYGSPQYGQLCGTDPYCGNLVSSNGCLVAPGQDVICELTGGFTYHGTARQRAKVRVGCVSARSGIKGARGMDPDGYSFVITTKLISVGTTFN